MFLSQSISQALPTQQWIGFQEITWVSFYHRFPSGHNGSSKNLPINGQSSNPAVPGLDISRLVPVVQELSAAGIVASIRKVYMTEEGRYSKFCAQAGFPNYPTSERVLMLLIVHMFMQRLAHGSIKSYLAAVRYSQVCRGLGDPGIVTSSQLEYVMKGIKRSSSQSMISCLPVTPDILRDLKQAWQEMDNKWEAKLLLAASCLCFLGFSSQGKW